MLCPPARLSHLLPAALGAAHGCSSPLRSSCARLLSLTTPPRARGRSPGAPPTICSNSWDALRVAQPRPRRVILVDQGGGWRGAFDPPHSSLSCSAQVWLLSSLAGGEGRRKRSRWLFPLQFPYSGGCLGTWDAPRTRDVPRRAQSLSPRPASCESRSGSAAVPGAFAVSGEENDIIHTQNNSLLRASPAVSPD